MLVCNSLVKPIPFSYKDILKTGLRGKVVKSSDVPFNSDTIGNNNQSRKLSRENEEKINSEMSTIRDAYINDSYTSSSRLTISADSSDSDITVRTLITSESGSNGKKSLFDSSNDDSPILTCGIMETERTTKKDVKVIDFLNPDWKLPGGKKYQKDGARLENAFYNGLSKRIKNNISVNVKPRHSNGNVIVEFDMIYQSDSSKRVISFEIKGVNPNTINNLERQKKLISQGLRQKIYLEENYSGYKVDCVYCFVTGKIKTFEINEESQINSEWKSVTTVRSKPILDIDFIKKIKTNGISVAIGETPQQCSKNALLMLNLLR